MRSYSYSKKICLGLTIFSLFLVGLPGFCSTAGAITWSVTVDAPYYTTPGTLCHAIENASDGDIIDIKISSITLMSPINIEKSITLYGHPTTIYQEGLVRVLSVNNYSESKITCIFHDITIHNQNGSGASIHPGVRNYENLTMYNCTVRNCAGGGGIYNSGALIMDACAVNNNTISQKNNYGYEANAAGIDNSSSGILTMYNCIVKGNQNLDNPSWGGGVANHGILLMYGCTVQNNKSISSGGGLLAFSSSHTILAEGCVIQDNSPDQITASENSSLVDDGSNTIGTSPGTSSVALAGMAPGPSPEPRSTAGESDVTAAEEDLNNSDSTLFGEIKEALSGDLQGISGSLSASLEGMDTTLYNAFAYENVPLEDTSGSGELEIEFTASWPRYVRYYAAFALAEADAGNVEKTLVPGSYVLPERGIQFEIQPGQDLPDGATPPDFYETGEGLRTWRNTVRDNGSFDLNPEAGVVTFRVCSVRAETEAPASGGGGSGGCHTGAGAASGFSLLLLLGLPLGINLHHKK